MPINYENGKIYRLLCNDEHYFIGSTANELRYCLNKHKQNSLNKLDLPEYKHINKLGWDNVKIELIEAFPCKSKKELNDREKFHLNEIKKKKNKLNLCLNNNEQIIENEIVSAPIIQDINNTKYAKGKIYKVTCSDKYYYIGSTICSLSQRLATHKKETLKVNNSNLSKHLAKNKEITTTIELIEKYPCKTNAELRAREDHFIQLNKDDKFCLNIKRAHATVEEKKENRKKYYEEHKNEILEYQREYAEENKEHIQLRNANYRLENAEKRCEYSKKYAQEHKEQVAETKKRYNKENADKIKETVKAYYEKNREQIDAYKKEWAQKKKEETAETRAAASEKKKAKRAEKSAARIAHDNEIQTCICGGTYQNYRKKRHDLGKKHLEYMASQPPP